MTYPPQQPGQPGPHGQNPYGQQPGQYGQQPGQYGQYGQQPPPYGQQPGQYGQQPGGPPKKKTGLIIAIVVAVLVLAGGGLTFFLLNQDDEPAGTANQDQTTGQQDPPPGDDPTGGADPTGGGEDPPAGTGEEEMLAVAQSYIEAIMAENEAAATALTCSGDSSGALYAATAGNQSELTIAGGQVDSEFSGTVEVGIGTQEPLPLPMSVQDGAWCVTL